MITSKVHNQILSSVIHMCPSHQNFANIGFDVTKIKGIFSDSNNIILWHESKDINKESLFTKFQSSLQYVHMHDHRLNTKKGLIFLRMSDNHH